MTTTPTLTPDQNLAHYCAQLDLAVSNVRSTAEGLNRAQGKPSIRAGWLAEHNKRVQQLDAAIARLTMAIHRLHTSPSMKTHAETVHDYGCRVLNAYLPLTPA
jgi:predicted hotdog family 3-hydroxylacyl-ACP dehydratase